MTAGLMGREKQSHASFDRRSREEKAGRIEAVLASRIGDLGSKDILDIGTGAGIIASHLARAARSLLSVDVVDERVVRDFEFRLVTSETLPAERESFDVVVSNQVIEHLDHPQVHLQEIRRVLRPGGVCYLATPNRFAIIEPHFRLPFLSWLPDAARDRYVRLARKGTRYDIQPLTHRELREHAARARLRFHDVSEDVVRAVLRERLGVRRIPATGFLRPLFPSFVVLMERGS